jgi:hypothetical protein
VSARQRNVIEEANSLRLRILNVSLLVAVVVGGLAFVRTLIDALELEAWMVVTATLLVYGGLVSLLVARRLSYRVRAVGFLAILFLAGVFGLLAAGYLPAPMLILASQNVLAAVLFGRRATWLAFGVNLLALLTAGALLATGVASLETTTFYDPTDIVDWLRVTAMFAVFAGIAIVSVDVLTRHLDQSLQEQAELVENLKGAMQLHDEAERHRRDAESRLQMTRHVDELARIANELARDLDTNLAIIASRAKALRTAEGAPRAVEEAAEEIENTALSCLEASRELLELARKRS